MHNKEGFIEMADDRQQTAAAGLTEEQLTEAEVQDLLESMAPKEYRRGYYSYEKELKEIMASQEDSPTLKEMKEVVEDQLQRWHIHYMEPLTEEQIEERVNGWREKWLGYIQYQARELNWDRRRIRKEEYEVEFSCREWFPKRLREDPNWIPTDITYINQEQGVTHFHTPLPFLTWVEEQETN
jgi:hypothetical protein